jgi:hypothetical protein
LVLRERKRERERERERVIRKKTNWEVRLGAFGGEVNKARMK